MAYESFKNSKNKLYKSWNRAEENTFNTNQSPIINLDFNSINFTKKIITIPIVTNQLFSIFTENVQTILLENFPEWAINMIDVNCVYNMEDGFTESPIVADFQTASDNETLKVGDLSITDQEFDYWFNNIDETNYNLKLYLRTIVRRVETLRPNLLPAFTTSIVPMFLTLSLKIVNQRVYETMNQHKE